jgi:SPP1 family predicted phage head-tail adaptor
MTLPRGRLRHRITIEEKIVDLDSDGATIEDWIPALRGAILPAEIEPISGREAQAAGATQAVLSTRIRIRAVAGVEPKMRALHRGTVYNIEAVVPDPDSGLEYRRLLCSSGIDDGGG